VLTESFTFVTPAPVVATTEDDNNAWAGVLYYPGAVYHAAARMHGRKHSHVFLRRLAWRDLTYWMLWKFPSLPDVSFRPHYESQAWHPDPDGARRRAWEQVRAACSHFSHCSHCSRFSHFSRAMTRSLAACGARRGVCLRVPYLPMSS
jgi:hypothetical protein